MHTDDYRELLRKYLAGECSAEEELLLDHWYNHLNANQPLADEETEKEKLVHANWQKLVEQEESLKGNRYRLPAFGQHLWRFRSVAAVIVLALTIGVIFSPRIRSSGSTGQSAITDIPDSLEFHTELASGDTPRLLILSDGSKVTLAAGSTLHYNASFGEDKREVFLKGEAYFEISEDPEKPFYVYANSIVTKVLGTSFLVNARDPGREVEVSVTKGKVAVYPAPAGASEIAADQEIILTPRQQVSYIKDKHRMNRSEIEDLALVVPKERPARVTFENAPVAALLETLQTMHHVTFYFETNNMFSLCTITTSMEDETLDEMLAIISKLLGIRYTISGHTVLLEGKGC